MRKLRVVRRPVRLSLGSAVPVTDAPDEAVGEKTTMEVGDLLDATEIGFRDPLLEESIAEETSADEQIARPRTNTATVSASDRLAIMKKTRADTAELRRTRKG